MVFFAFCTVSALPAEVRYLKPPMVSMTKRAIPASEISMETRFAKTGSRHFNVAGLLTFVTQPPKVSHAPCANAFGVSIETLIQRVAVTAKLRKNSFFMQ